MTKPYWSTLDNIKQAKDYISTANGRIDYIGVEVSSKSRCAELGLTVRTDKSYYSPLPHKDVTVQLGQIFVILAEILDIAGDERCSLIDFDQVPCRLVLQEQEPIGIGHFMYDRFVLFDTLLSLTKEEV